MMVFSKLLLSLRRFERKLEIRPVSIDRVRGSTASMLLISAKRKSFELDNAGMNLLYKTLKRSSMTTHIFLLLEHITIATISITTPITGGFSLKWTNRYPRKARPIIFAR